MPNDNAIMLIEPYRTPGGSWVFDDPATGLVKEPFVSGADTMMTLLTQGIADADHGFRLLFSRTPFPGYQVKLDWRREEIGGHWYFSAQLGLEGWLCPAMFKYFTTAPRVIYAKAEPRPSR